MMFSVSLYMSLFYTGQSMSNKNPANVFNVFRATGWYCFNKQLNAVCDELLYELFLIKRYFNTPFLADKLVY